MPTDTFFHYLTGYFKPLRHESSVNNLPVVGTLPSDLKGTFMRNGPNPQFKPLTYTYPYDGDGMIHALYFVDGRVSYRNRYVITNELLAERRAQKALYGGIAKPIFPDPQYLQPEDSRGPIKGGRFINVIHYAGRYIALHEMTTALEITEDLKTLGEWRPSGKALEMTPHVRFDPKLRELYLINYSLDEPRLLYHRLDSKGNHLQTVPIDMPYTSMMHDFVLTERYVIFFDCAVLASVDTLMEGKGFYQWKPDLGGRIGLMRRDGSEPIVWIETPPFFVFHFANGYDKGDEAVVDFIHYDAFYLDPDLFRAKTHPSLMRVILNAKAKTAQFITLDEKIIEFPRINTQFTSQPHRFVYTTAFTNPSTGHELSDTYNALIKYDVENGKKQMHDFGAHAFIGEPVFIPRQGMKGEDDGYLILYVYYSDKDYSECVLLSAQNVEEEPLARIQMPVNIPAGLHGSWINEITDISSSH